MNTLESLRPEVRPLDTDWSTATLEAILSDHIAETPRRTPKGRRLALVGGVAAATLGLGGVAYATGLIPDSVTGELGWISSSKVSGVHEVASFSFDSEGRTRSFVIWRGTNADGLSCTAVLEAEARFGPEFGGNCGGYPTDAWFDRTTESWKGTIEDTPPPSTYFVYGEPEAGVTSVRVAGAGFEHTVPVDPATGGFAVAIPELGDHASGDFATVEFLDANGTVLSTRTLHEKEK